MRLPSGKEVYPSSRITQNFTWGEATWNCTRVPQSLKIENNIINTAINLQTIRTLLGSKPLIITSWYRPPAVNQRVGGASNSTHLQGYAVDFRCHLPPQTIFEILNATHPGGLGWYAKGWVHIDWRNWDKRDKARWNG